MEITDKTLILIDDGLTFEGYLPDFQKIYFTRVNETTLLNWGRTFDFKIELKNPSLILCQGIENPHKNYDKLLTERWKFFNVLDTPSEKRRGRGFYLDESKRMKKKGKRKVQVIDPNGKTNITIPDFKCLDCEVDVVKINERFLVRDEIWNKYGIDGVLCIGCLEVRLTRQLRPSDFASVLINQKYNGLGRKSKRFLARITQEVEK